MLLLSRTLFSTSWYFWESFAATHSLISEHDVESVRGEGYGRRVEETRLTADGRGGMGA